MTTSLSCIGFERIGVRKAWLCGFSAIFILCVASAYSDTIPGSDDCKNSSVASPRPKEDQKKKRPAAERADSASLFTAAAKLYSKGKIEDAGFLFYAGQIRAKIDLESYKSVGTGGNDPALAIAVARIQLGAIINPLVMRDREVFRRVVSRLSIWFPAYDPNYQPGWDFKSAPSESEFQKKVDQIRSLWLKQMQELGQLLNHDEYFRWFRIVQDYNLTDADFLQSLPKGSVKQFSRVSEEEYKSAIRHLKQIETARGYSSGLFSDDKTEIVDE